MQPPVSAVSVVHTRSEIHVNALRLKIEPVRFFGGRMRPIGRNAARRPRSAREGCACRNAVLNQSGLIFGRRLRRRRVAAAAADRLSDGDCHPVGRYHQTGRERNKFRERRRRRRLWLTHNAPCTAGRSDIDQIDHTPDCRRQSVASDRRTDGRSERANLKPTCVCSDLSICDRAARPRWASGERELTTRKYCSDGDRWTTMTRNIAMCFIAAVLSSRWTLRLTGKPSCLPNASCRWPS